MLNTEPPPGSTRKPFASIFRSSRCCGDRHCFWIKAQHRSPDATDRAALSNLASQRGRPARIVLGRLKPDVVKLLQSRANWMSYGVLHCCSVDVGLLKVRLAPGSDRTTNESADPGCANSGHHDGLTNSITFALTRTNDKRGCGGFDVGQGSTGRLCRYRLLVEPDVLHAPAVGDAVDHDRQSFHIGLPTAGTSIVKDDRACCSSAGATGP
jgi:hypothetical protein